MKDIDKYLANLSDEQKREINRVLKITLKTVPEAKECITYGMPGFKYKGKYLIAYSAAKNHYGMYPGSGAVVDLKKELKGFDTSKGTIRYTLENPITEDTLKKVLLYRKSDIDSK